MSRSNRLHTYFCTGVFCLGLLGSCAQSNFAGSSSPKKEAAAKKKDAETDEPSDEPTKVPSKKISKTPDGDGDIEDDGEEEPKEEEPIEETNEVCAASSPETPVDEAATFVFANEGETRPFLNSLGKYTHVNETFFDAGGVQADQASADAVCNIKGYKRASTFESLHYHSCGDNFVYPWSAAAKNFEQKGACTNNNRIGRLECKGKLKDICGKDPGWVFGQAPVKDP